MDKSACLGEISPPWRNQPAMEKSALHWQISLPLTNQPARDKTPHHWQNSLPLTKQPAIGKTARHWQNSLHCVLTAYPLSLSHCPHSVPVLSSPLGLSPFRHPPVPLSPICGPNDKSARHWQNSLPVTNRPTIDKTATKAFPNLRHHFGHFRIIKKKIAFPYERDWPTDIPSYWGRI